MFFGGVGAVVAVATTPDLARGLGEFHDEFVRMLLVPLDGGFGAVNADVQVVFVAGGNLRGEEHAAGAAFVADEHAAVVIERPTGDEGVEVGGDLFELEAGDVAGEVFRVRSDVAHAVGNAGDARVHPPVGDRAVGLFLERGDGIALWIFGDDLEDAAELAGLHHGAGFLDHRIAGVVVRQGEDETGRIDEFLEFLGFC